MILYFNKNGQLLEQLEYGNVARVGTTNFQIFAYFNDIDLNNYGSALIRFKRPDLNGSEYPDLFMVLASINYDDTIEASNYFNEENNPYIGYVFDFDTVTDGSGKVVLLDTPGEWEATITLINGAGTNNVIGLVKFMVEGSVSSVDDELTELDYSVIVHNIAAAFIQKLDKQTGTNIVYTNDSNGDPSYVPYTNLPVTTTIPVRDTDGNIQVGAASNNFDATNKYYVDNAISTALTNAAFVPYLADDGTTIISLLPELCYVKVSNKWYLLFRQSTAFLQEAILVTYDGYYRITGATVASSTINSILATTKHETLEENHTANQIYGVDNSGYQANFNVDYGTNYGGNVVRRNGSSQIYVPTTPTADAHAASKYYVDQVAETIKQNEFEVADYTEYTSLADFMNNYQDAEEGIIYLYPIDTSDLTKGYYQLIWEGNDWIELGTTVIDLSDYYSKSASLVPSANNTYDLGSASYTFKDLYLSGDIIQTKNNITNKIVNTGDYDMDFYINNALAYRLSSANFRPASHNARDLGTTSFYWRNCYFAGTLYGLNYGFTINSAYRILYGKYTTSSSQTELDYETMYEISVSANTTFTLKTPPTGCYPEYKAIITNNGASAINLTMPSGMVIKTNDEDNVIINSNVITLNVGITIEVNVVNNKMIAFNWNAQ